MRRLRFILRPSFTHIRPTSYPLLHRRPLSDMATTDMATTVNKTAHPFDKTRLDATLNRRFFYAPAFEIYGGMSDDCSLLLSSHS